MKVSAPSLEAISKQKVQIDIDGVLNQGESHGLSAAVRHLQRISQGAPDHMGGFYDPLTDFRLQQMDLVEKLQERQHAMQVQMKQASDICLQMQHLRLMRAKVHFHQGLRILMMREFSNMQALHWG